MKNSPLVSVVLPVYNCEKYLKSAIDSILSQSYSNFELIIINDGSTDKSLDIIKSYHDKRIRIISRENKGLVFTLNEGLLLAKGKYIARMDGDDKSLPLRFEYQVNFLEKNLDYSMCGTWFKILKNGKKEKQKVPTKNENIKYGLIFHNMFAHPSVMLRKDFIINNKIFYCEEFKNVEDYELWTRIVFLGKVANLPYYLFEYRIVEDSVSNIAIKNIELYNSVHQQILENYLNQFGINVTEGELKIHRLLANRNEIEKIKLTSENANLVYSWLSKLTLLSDNKVLKKNVIIYWAKFLFYSTSSFKSRIKYLFKKNILKLFIV